MRYDRLNALLEALTERRQMTVEQLSNVLGVSPATIRRDLDHLAHQQLLTRTRGGAVASGVTDLPLRYKTGRHASEKGRIGEVAARLVTPGMVVGMNGGTTTTEVARSLAQRKDLVIDGDEQLVTVVTNAINIAGDLAPRRHVKVVVTGGVARPQSYELIGPLAQQVIDELSLDVMFLGLDGIHANGGATTVHEGEASINRALAARARKVVAVADGSKIGVRSFARICHLSDIDVLITTPDLADVRSLEALCDAGVEVIKT